MVVTYNIYIVELPFNWIHVGGTLGQDDWLTCVGTWVSMHLPIRLGIKTLFQANKSKWIIIPTMMPRLVEGVNSFRSWLPWVNYPNKPLDRETIPHCFHFAHEQSLWGCGATSWCQQEHAYHFWNSKSQISKHYRWPNQRKIEM